MPATCSHLDQIADVSPRTPAGCEECLQSGDAWVHLRMCLTCGHVGCCESSKNQHATKHYRSTDHALIKSFQPGEVWAYCYPDDLFFESLEPGETAGRSQ
ncbi:MAG: UBP-type zinc finger domain-containing protein [Gemmatimonadaceae bacterium]